MSDFGNAGKQPGLELWRIENFKPVKQPKVNTFSFAFLLFLSCFFFSCSFLHVGSVSCCLCSLSLSFFLSQVTGKFFSGDSYILLATLKSKTGSSLSWNIHFWLGAETSHDEAGTAAYKSVELDDGVLGGAAVQYREVQGNESAQFLSYFKATGGISYEAGGIASGFKHVEKDVYSTRLLHCKGKRTVRVKEVPVNVSSLNKGDVFILDKGKNFSGVSISVSYLCVSLGFFSSSLSRLVVPLFCFPLLSTHLPLRVLSFLSLPFLFLILYIFSIPSNRSSTLHLQWPNFQ
jgi:gelsolin